LTSEADSKHKQQKQKNLETSIKTNENKQENASDKSSGLRHSARLKSKVPFENLKNPEFFSFADIVLDGDSDIEDSSAVSRSTRKRRRIERVASDTEKEISDEARLLNELVDDDDSDCEMAAEGAKASEGSSSSSSLSSPANSKLKERLEFRNHVYKIIANNQTR
jgi:hypothetical protein